MEHTLHERVAQLARERGVLNADESERALFEIQTVIEEEGQAPLGLWVERGWLTEAILESLLGEYRPTTDEHRQLINGARVSEDALRAFVHAETVVREHDALALVDELEADDAPSTQGQGVAEVDADLPDYAVASGIAGNISSVGSDTLANLMTLYLATLMALL